MRVEDHMKRNIMLGLLNSVLCLSLMGNSSIEKVSAQHIDHNQINSIRGVDPPQVGCGPMDGDVYDWSTFGNNGAAVGGPTYPSGHSGLAIHLNGTSQYVTVQNNNSLNITDSITLAAWIKPEKSATQDLLKEAVTDDTDGYEISLSSDTKVIFHLNQNTSSDTYRIVSSQSYPIDGEIWIHVAATYNFGTNLMRLYINGVQDGTAITGPGAIASNDLFLGIGVQGDYDVSRLFQGAVDDVRIYNRALSAFEIKALYDETTPDGYTCTSLIARESTANTEHKPMSKTWIYDGKWWSVFPASTGVSSAGAWLWRLDGIVWTPVLKLSDTTVTKADVKP